MSIKQKSNWSDPNSVYNSDIYRKKKSEVHKNVWSDPEFRRKMHLARLGKTSHPNPFKGVPRSQEVRDKISKSKKGTVFSPEHCRRISESRKGAKNWNYGKFSGENNPNWNGGASFKPYCYKFTEEFRERVRAFWGYTCALCGKTQEVEKRRLSVHHVNYQKMACCDENTHKYFVPLCWSCHTKTNFDREKWEEKLTRIIEKKHGGKCYFHKPEILTGWGVCDV